MWWGKIGNSAIQLLDGIAEFCHQKMIAEPVFCSVESAREVPQLSIWSCVEPVPHGLRIISSREIGQQRLDIVEEIGSPDQDRFLRNPYHPLVEFPLARLPGFAVSESRVLVLGDFEHEFEDLLSNRLANGFPAVRIRDVLEVVVEKRCGQHLVPNSDASENAHASHEMGDVWDAVFGQRNVGRATA